MSYLNYISCFYITLWWISYFILILMTSIWYNPCCFYCIIMMYSAWDNVKNLMTAYGYLILFYIIIQVYFILILSLDSYYCCARLRLLIAILRQLIDEFIMFWILILGIILSFSLLFTSTSRCIGHKHIGV